MKTVVNVLAANFSKKRTEPGQLMIQNFQFIETSIREYLNEKTSYA